MPAQSTGAFGEEQAARYLEEQGYQILEQRYRTRYGEIDIIAAKQPYIVFVEVKTRGRNALARPGAFVGPAKQGKLIKTALLYLSEHRTSLQPRFDVAEVVAEDRPLRLIELHYLPNAFDASGYSGA